MFSRDPVGERGAVARNANPLTPSTLLLLSILMTNCIKRQMRAQKFGPPLGGAGLANSGCPGASNRMPTPTLGAGRVRLLPYLGFAFAKLFEHPLEYEKEPLRGKYNPRVSEQQRKNFTAANCVAKQSACHLSAECRPADSPCLQRLLIL